MKQKEMVQLGVAVVILAIAGFLIYSQLFAQKHGSAPKKVLTVEKVTAIKPDFDKDAIAAISDANKVRDFYNVPDLKSGLGNKQPFGPLN